MILLLDVGNTRIKWGCHDGHKWLGQGVLPTTEPDRLAAVLTDWRPAWVGIACVAGPAVGEAIEKRLADTPRHWLTSAETGHGLANRYDRPETLGVDRYAALLACARMGLAPCVVASAGTALTADALAGDGVFLGGMIAPGVGLMRLALARGTAGVGAASGAVQVFPRSTADAVESGIRAALVGVVETLRGDLAARLGDPVKVVLTGGDADWLAEGLAGPVVIERNLVLEGLLWLARDLGKSAA